MLRSFEHDPNKKYILEALSRFDIELPARITLVSFEVITPDSFLWRILIGDSVYYLYAEDYVPGLAYVKSIFSQYLGNENWEFIKPRIHIKFEDAKPVKAAFTYKKADDAGAMMRYAIDSGYDFVFLVRSSENPKQA